MLGLLKIYFLVNLHFILIKCLASASQKTDDLTVRIVDRELIARKRQDTRDMCKLFNSEAIQASLLKETQPLNKYDKRKQLLKLKEKKKEIQKKKSQRYKRAVNSVNPALNAEDELRVETIVEKIYDDLLEKGEKIAYRRRNGLKVKTKDNVMIANKTGRRFPFAPIRIDGPTSTKSPDKSKTDMTSKPVRFTHAIVPYFIDSKTYDSHLADTIMNAFDYFEKATCIRLQRLRERPTDQQSLQNVVWLYITNPSGIRQCVHSNERAEIKGVQMIVFGYDCMSLGDITHEIMHVLGFAHEHVRPDRDQYITILWDNIKPGYRKYFEVHDKPIVENLPYDYASVLHYPPRAFSRNGQATILTEPSIKIGQREGLSEMDVEKIGMLYSNECIKRNREYLLKTCPSVVKSDTTLKPIAQQDIEDYFQDRLWPYGVINYRFRDNIEFSADEIENINAVIRHIEKETCVEFRELTSKEPLPEDSSSTEYKFNTEEMDRIIVLASDENETKTAMSNEELANAIIDPVKTARKGVNGKYISHVKDKLANNDAKKKDSNIGAKDRDVNVDAKGKNTNISVKEKTANVTRKQPGLRRKRAVTPTPTRRHANNILVLTRSPQPGCHCPHPGKPEGRFVLTINSDCFNTVNDLLHLFVHVLGLDHQHNMHDRDSYLHIIWDQLTEDVKQEMKRKLPPAASVGFPYDYQSVMHYPWLQIKNGKTNIMYPIWNDGWAMGHWQGLSSTDVQKINLLYFKQCMERRQAEELKNTPEENKEHSNEDENEYENSQQPDQTNTE